MNLFHLFFWSIENDRLRTRSKPTDPQPSSVTSPHLELKLRKLPVAEYWQLAHAGTRATAIEARFGLFLMWIFLLGVQKRAVGIGELLYMCIFT